jgi:hypothetical protein
VVTNRQNHENDSGHTNDPPVQQPDSVQLLTKIIYKSIKEKTLKITIAVLALAIFTTVNSGFSKEPSGNVATVREQIESATRNYAAGLQSENTGIVESSIQRIAKMKLQVPSTNTDDLQKQLNRLSLTHQSAIVRYKAYLASSICADPEWFNREKSLVDADEQLFFIYAAERLQRKVFGANSY